MDAPLEDVDYLRLLGSPDGITTLLEGGKALGISVKTANWDNTIDFGAFSRDNLRNDAPEGYEDDSNGDMFIFQGVEVAFHPVMKGVNSMELVSFQLIPKEENYRVRLVTADGNDVIPTVMKEGETQHFRVEVVFPESFRQGSINKILLLSFRGQTKYSPVSVVSAACSLGIKIQGNLMSSADVKLGRQLSADAKPFVPEVAKTYFDYPCQTIMCNSFDAPSGFKDILYFFFQIEDYIRQDYRSLTPLQLSKEFVQESPASICFDTSSFDHVKHIKNMIVLNKFEFLQMQYDIKYFDLRYERVHFKQNLSEVNEMVCRVVVKGSNENRPKINIGDQICFRPAQEDLSKYKLNLYEIRGVITDFKLKTEMVTCVCQIPSGSDLCFERIASNRDILRIVSSPRYHVRFNFDFSGSAFIHEALEQLLHSPQLQLALCPPKNLAIKSSDPVVIRCLSEENLNALQREAVQSACTLLSLSIKSHLAFPSSFTPTPPYIIFGPPGTGKTKTLVALVRGALEVCGEGGRVLACAPSDAAADVICSRLSQYYQPEELMRLNWWQRQQASVPVELIRHCFVHERGTFDLPLQQMKTFKIIVCTSVVAGILRKVGLSFDLIALDEVSQATEAESMVPASLVKPSGLIVLCGDPEQLGPTPRSPVFRIANMQKSLQERLLQHSMYDNVRPCLRSVGTAVREDFTRAKLGVFLQHNYRSQKSIFETSSKLFYEGSLLEKGHKASLDSLAGWEKLSGAVLRDSEEPRPFLVLFHSIASGVHQHEMNSPSFYNIGEIGCVVEMCSSLLGSSDVEVSQGDIGVIGAFRAQVLKLRQALRAANLGGINVGSVEDFQGQECRVIIVTTVLSKRVPQCEISGSLGLCGDHRKFNVAVTRGKSLTIVVGNPWYLHGDRCWRELMEYCDAHEAFSGDSFPLLSRLLQEEKENKEMLQAAAEAALLDAGSYKNESSGHNLFSMNNSELEWRGFL